MRWRQWGSLAALVVVGLMILGAGVWTLTRGGRYAAVGFTVLLLLPIVLLTWFSPDKTQAFLARWLVHLVVLIIVATSFAVARSTRTGSLRFYEIAAQVMPTLVLALAIEIRLVRGSPRHEMGLVFPFIILVLLGVGEFFALKAIVTESPTRTDFQSVVSTMTGAFAGIVLGALVVSTPDRDGD